MDSSTESSIGDLFYRGKLGPGETGPKPLPKWARYLAWASAKLAALDEKPITLGITLPTRAYAAAISAAAYALRREQIDPLVPSDLDAQIENLRQVPVNTPVKYFGGGKVWDGRFLGINEVDGTEMIVVETAPKKMIRKLPLDFAPSVRPTGDSELPGVLRSKSLEVPSALKALLPKDMALAYATSSRTDCIVVGIRSLFYEDLSHRVLCQGPAANNAEYWCFEDLVRAQDSVSSKKRAFRTLSVASSPGPTPEERDIDPGLVIFDGGPAYLRWRHCWDQAHHVVLIDRSMPSAEEAGGELSLEFLERIGDPVADGGDVPRSLEVVQFERAT